MAIRIASAFSRTAGSASANCEEKYVLPDPGNPIRVMISGLSLFMVILSELSWIVLAVFVGGRYSAPSSRGRVGLHTQFTVDKLMAPTVPSTGVIGEVYIDKT